MLRCALPLAATLLFAAPLAAQDFDTTTVFGRAMQRRLAADPTLTESDFSAVGRDLSRLDDTMVVAFARLMAAGIGRIPAEHCDILDRQDDFGFMNVLAGGADSSEAEQWVTVLGEIFRPQIENTPVGAVAPPGVAAAMLTALTTRTSPKEQQAFAKARRLQVQGPCLMMPLVLGRLAGKNPGHVAPILRFVFLSADAR
jgi:hypothetical protein